MKWKNVLSTLMLVFLLAPTLIPVSVVQSPDAYGPKTPNMFIKNYGNRNSEFEALEAGKIDIVDEPLIKTYIDKWTLGPDGIPVTGDELVYNGIPGTDQIRLKDYLAIDDFDFDLNNQRWPTGVAEPRQYDPATGTYKHYYGTAEPSPLGTWDDEARYFRIALAYLTDKAYILTEILKGYGFIKETPVPYPFQPIFTNYTSLETNTTHQLYPITGEGLIYHHNVTTALAILDAAGFRLRPDGVRQDPRKADDPAYPGYKLPLDPLIFYIRSDDPYRKLAGEKLVVDMQAVGIPVDVRIVNKTVAFKAVMVEYNYHLYTGNWGLDFEMDSTPQDWLDKPYHSSMYWGGSETSYYDGIGYSINYPGFALHEFDAEAEKLRYATTSSEIVSAALKAQEIFAQYLPTIPLWSSAAVKAYRTGWEGVVNMMGYGVDNYYSFLNMYNPIDNTINWGFRTNLEGLNPVTSQWRWDTDVLGLVYDSLIRENPYFVDEPYDWLVTYSVGPDGKRGTADDVPGWQIGTWTGGVYIDFYLRPGIKFHDLTDMTPEDIKFSIEFTRDCGPGVAWNYPMARDVENVTITGANSVRVFYNAVGPWTLYWAGSIPIINKDLWMAANAKYGWGYGTPTWNTTKVREYHPWENDANDNGIIDLKEDGTGPWIFQNADPFLMDYVSLTANTNFHKSQVEISDYIKDAYHRMGDVNKDGVISSADLGLIYHALYTTPADDGIPGTWWAWNPAADLNSDGIVDNLDLWTAAANYGMSAGGLYAGEPSNPPAASSSTIYEITINSSNPPSVSSDTVVYVDPLKSMALPGTTFTVNITIANVKNLFAWQVKLSWNPALLKVIRVQEGPFLKQLPGTTFLTTRINNTVGYAWIGVTGTGRGFRGAYGSGTLANVTFSVKSKGRCTLDLSNTTLTDPWIPHPWWYNPLISHTAEDGYFRSTLLGDITGPLSLPDGTVNIWDLRKLGISYGLTPGKPNWDPNADVTGPAEVPDGVIDLWDLTAVANDYGKSIDP